MSAIVADVNAPKTEVPKRPTLYALATVNNGKWTLSYGGMERSWLEQCQQPLHAGSCLVIVPSEDDLKPPPGGTIRVDRSIAPSAMTPLAAEFAVTFSLEGDKERTIAEVVAELRKLWDRATRGGA